MNLFRKKSIDALLREAGGKGASLKKELGALDLTMLGIGAIIGTGIFVLTGVAAAEHAGPALVLSFILSGLACVFAALCTPYGTDGFVFTSITSATKQNAS